MKERSSGIDVLKPGKDETDYAPHAGYQMPDGAPFMKQDAISDLTKIRAQFPFLSVMRMPRSITVECVAADTAYTIDIPDRAIIATIQATENFYISTGGACKSVATDMGEGQLLNPSYSWFYIGNKRQISVMSPVAGAIVQLQYHVQEN